jgi:hypothetical protein
VIVPRHRLRAVAGVANKASVPPEQKMRQVIRQDLIVIVNPTAS